MSSRVCGICGDLPCKCRIGKCSNCGVRLNLDNIGMPLMEWNKIHNQQTGCQGMIIDKRILKEMEEATKKQLQFIENAKKGGSN